MRSHREAAARFGVSPASVSRWWTLEREQGNPQPSPLGGDRRSSRIEAQAVLIRQLVDDMADATVEDCARRSVHAGSRSAMARCSASSGGTASRAKKTAHAAEQDRPDILKRHWEWFESQPDLDPDRLVFID